MARSDLTDTAIGRRILENAQDRRFTDPREQAQADAVERLLSRPTTVSTKRRRKRKKPRPPLALMMFKMLVVGLFVWGGIHAIVWMRDLALDYGIVWVGDE